MGQGFLVYLSEPRTPAGDQLQVVTKDIRESPLSGRLCRQQRHHPKKHRDGTAHGRGLDRPGNEGGKWFLFPFNRLGGEILSSVMG